MVNLSNSFFYNILNYFSNPCRDDQYVETNENISTPQKEIPHLMNSINDLEERIGRLKIEDDYLQQQIVDLNERTKSFLKPSPAFKFRKRVPKLKTSPKLTKLQKKLLNFKKRKITKNEKNILKRLENGLENATASEFDNFLVTFNDMQCLNPGKWLNDEIINFYMGLLQKRSDERMVVRKERDFFFNTFFYTTLTGNNMSSYHYNNVRRWTKRKKIDIFTLNKIFIPINLNNAHWTLAVIDIKTKRIQYFDSFLEPNEKAMKSLRRYLEDEHKDKKSQNLRLEFETKMVRNLPRQENGFDCGVFVCKAAEFLSDGMPLVYKQSDMGLLRKRMALEIMMKKTDSEIFEE